MNTRYGISIKNLIDAAKKYESVDLTSNRERILVYMCKNLLRTLQYTQSMNGMRGPHRSTIVSASSNVTLNTNVSDLKTTTPPIASKKQVRKAEIRDKYLADKRDLNDMVLMLNSDLNTDDPKRQQQQPIAHEKKIEAVRTSCNNHHHYHKSHHKHRSSRHLESFDTARDALGKSMASLERENGIYSKLDDYGGGQHDTSAHVETQATFTMNMAETTDRRTRRKLID
jgi:hypothetical protein